MKNRYWKMFLLILAGCADHKEYLFNGQNLEGWVIYVEDTAINPDDFFYVKDGTIETIGIPMGYMRTIKEYLNYQLHLEWRYPEKPTNSGVFLHTSGPDLLWPTHYQGQFKYENAGDFILEQGGEVFLVEAKHSERPSPTKLNFEKVAPSPFFIYQSNFALNYIN